MNEQEFLRGLKKGNVTVYENFVDTYSRYVTAIVGRVGRTLPSQEVEELVADVFIKMWHSRKKLNIKDGCLKAYLAITAKNLTLNRLKVLGKIDEVGFGENEGTLDILDSPETQILQAETQAIIIELIDMLPSPDKEIFVRRYLNFESLKEISSKMDIPVGTVGTKIARTKIKLKSSLLERGVRYEC